MCNEQYPLPGSAVLKLHRKLTNKGLTIYHEDRHVTKLTYAVYVCHFYWVSVNEKIWYFFGDVSALSETYLFFFNVQKGEILLGIEALAQERSKWLDR